MFFSFRDFLDFPLFFDYLFFVKSVHFYSQQIFFHTHTHVSYSWNSLVFLGLVFVVITISQRSHREHRFFCFHLRALTTSRQRWKISTKNWVFQKIPEKSCDTHKNAAHIYSHHYLNTVTAAASGHYTEKQLTQATCIYEPYEAEQQYAITTMPQHGCHPQ